MAKQKVLNVVVVVVVVVIKSNILQMKRFCYVQGQ